jgi:hypothetical protein
MSLAGLVVVGCLALGMPAGALAAEAPAIGSTVAYGITQSDATLEAPIDPGALPEGVYYQFQVVANTSEYLPELACPEHGVPLSKPDGCGGPDSGPTSPGALPIGYIEKEPESRYVRLDLAAAGMTLKPGTTYHYRVLAAKRVQSEDTLNWEGPPAVGPDQTFTTLTPGTPPGIEGESATNITSTDATLEAKIKPEGLATTYEFYLEAPSCANDKRVEACEAGGGVPIAKGSVPAGSAAQTVSVDVAGTGHSLTPDTIEGYRVVASNSAGTTEGPFFNTFTTLAGPPPVIESESVSHLTTTDATIEAQINTGGRETTYRVWVGNYPECIEEMMEECDSSAKHPISGILTGSSSPTRITVDVAHAWHALSPGSSYIYNVDATNSDWAFQGSAYGGNKTFTTPAAKAPAIDSESVSHVTSTDATLEAQINTEGLETKYVFYLQGPVFPCLEAEPPCMVEEPAPVALPAGNLLGSFADQSVSADLNSAGISLDPGAHYRYWVAATSAAGATQGSVQRFITPEDGVQPLGNVGPSALSGSGQSGTSSAPSGSGGSSSTPNVNAPGLQVAKTTTLKSLTNARKLARALKLCAKKPKQQRASCKKQAHKQYGTTTSRAKKR